MSVPCEEIRPELEALLGRMTEGGLDADGRRRLSSILRDHPDARQVYLDYCQMHALLKSAHGVLQALEAPSPRRRLRWTAAAAALLALAGGALLLRPAPSLEVSVAGPAWVVQGGERVPASRLRAGDRLVTDVAPAELKFADGTSLRLEAGSELQVDRERLLLKEGAIRASIVPRPRPLVFATPHAQARVLGTTFDLLSAWNETRLRTTSGRMSLTSDGRGVEVGPGEVATADGRDLHLWTPVCAYDFSTMKALPPQFETVFCESALLHTPGRKVVSEPDRARFANGGLILGPEPGPRRTHGLVVTRWREETGEDLIVEADVAGGERWSLGFSVSGDSFEGYRIIFAVEGYPTGIAVDTIHPVETVVLARDPRPIPFDRDHTLRVEWRASRMRVWIDRELRIDTRVAHPLPEARRRTFALSNFGQPPVLRGLRVWKPARP